MGAQGAIHTLGRGSGKSGQMRSNKCGQAWARGGGSQKFTNLCGHLLWMTPKERFNKNLFRRNCYSNECK